jgi:hypothetical protein
VKIVFSRREIVQDDVATEYLSFIDRERGGFGGILPEVMIFPEGLCPEGSIITEGNISTNPPSGVSVK